MRISMSGTFMLLPLLIAVSPANAVTVIDPINDFLPSYTGPHRGDLDVTSLSVGFNSATNFFTLGATFAGDINPTDGTHYVFGVNTGTGLIRPFASIGAPNVIFNQAIIINSDGTGRVFGSSNLSPSSINIVGNILTAQVPLSLLPSTGFAPQQYGFNLWPRVGFGDNNQISDFAPDNATISVSAVPEPATWAMMILGFGAIGFETRRRKKITVRVSYAV